MPPPAAKPAKRSRAPGLVPAEDSMPPMSQEEFQVTWRQSPIKELSNLPQRSRSSRGGAKAEKAKSMLAAVAQQASG